MGATTEVERFVPRLRISAELWDGARKDLELITRGFGRAFLHMLKASCR